MSLVRFNDNLNFNNIKNSEGKHLPIIWKAAENLLSFGEKSYKISKIENLKITVKETIEKQSLLYIVLKVVVCATLLPITLAALIIKAAYRKHYSVEIFTPKQEERPNSLVETSSRAATNNAQLNPEQNEENPLLSEHLTDEKSTEKNAYQIEDVIAKIFDAKNRGQKLGIFLGRSNDQSLPEDDCEWFSLDLNRNEGNCDHHLQANFNDRGLINRLKNLFDKVIVDYSSIKCMAHPWPKLYSLMKKDPASELITESSSGVTQTVLTNKVEFFPESLTAQYPMSEEIEFYNQENRNFNEWKNTVGMDKVNQEKQDYISHSSSLVDFELRFKRHILKKYNIAPIPPSHENELLESIRAHLTQHYFNSVELKEGPFPCRTEVMKYWVLHSPKKLN